jgi:molecular chaperone HscB
LRSIFYRKTANNITRIFIPWPTEEQQAEMLELATLNNDAYQTFPTLTNEYAIYLKIKGLLEDEGKLSIPQEFLLDMMDINEALMELEFDFGSESPKR